MPTYDARGNVTQYLPIEQLWPQLSEETKDNYREGHGYPPNWNPGGPTTPTGQGQQAGKSLLEILQSWRAGQYGDVTKPETKAKVLADLYAFWTSMGATPAVAAQRADISFADEFAPKPTAPAAGVPTPSTTGPVGTVASTGPGTATQPTIPTAQVQSTLTPEQVQQRYLEELGGGAQGREALFSRFLDRQYPTAPGPFRSFLNRQEDALSNQYLLSEGLKGGQKPLSYQDFLQQQGGQFGAGLGPEAQQAYLRTAATLLSNPQQNTAPQYQAFRQFLSDDPSQQYKLAVNSLLPGIAAPFRNAYERYAGRQFNNFSLDQPEQPFLPWFVNRNFQF